MYRTRLVCATYARMNIVPLLGGRAVKFFYLVENKPFTRSARVCAGDGPPAATGAGVGCSRHAH